MMNRLEFSIIINADHTSIWKALWEDHSYREWASIFFKGSYMLVPKWEAGSHVHFLTPDQSGIFSRIEKYIPNKLIQFKHLGSVKDGIEQAMDEETKKWTGATESYQLISSKDHIRLQVDIDVMDEHLAFMKSTFPIALEKIKQNCK